MPAPTLAVNVVVIDPATNQPVQYAAGDTPPEWAQRLILNPAAWVGGVAPFVTPAPDSVDAKESCRAATTANLGALSGLLTVDGVVLAAKDRVLVKDQATGADNGIYLVRSGPWQRASDANTSAKVTSGLATFVSEGTANGGKTFVLTTADPVVLGTTALTFAAAAGGSGAVTSVAGRTGAVTLAEADVASLVADLAAKAPSLTRAGVKTNNYGAAANELVPVDTTARNVTITLPNAPAVGTLVVVKHIIVGAGNAVTVNTAGADVYNKAGGATGLTLSQLAQAVLLQYDAAGAIWTVLADDLPLAQLDARFAPITAIPEASVTGLVADLAAKAADNAVVHTTGAEAVAGVKTFSAAPVVPAASFPEAAVTGLVADLAAKEATANKGAASGYAALDVGSRVAQSPKLHHAEHEPSGADALTLTNIIRFGTAAAKPAASAALEGVYYFETNTTGGTLWQVQNAAWVQIGRGVTPGDVQIFTSSGTWAKPAVAYKSARVIAIGAGGGGGAGRRTASGTVGCGGGGGAGGGISVAEFQMADLANNESVTVGASGGGAAAQTADSTNGANGSGGGASLFGTGQKLRASGGSGGSGGSTTAGAGGGAGSGWQNGQAGSSASTSGGAGASPGSTVTGGAAGGGSGGGLATVPAVVAGGVGGSPLLNGATTGGTAGTTDGQGGGNGGDSAVHMPGAGGGGGASSIVAAGGAGGAGGLYGAGGGGGGASENGFNSGPGGAGAPGIVVVICT